MTLQRRTDRLENVARARSSQRKVKAPRFPQKGKPLKMIDQYPDGSLFTSGPDRQEIKSSIVQLQKKYSLIVVRLKKKPEINPA